MSSICITSKVEDVRRIGEQCPYSLQHRAVFPQGQAGVGGEQVPCRLLSLAEQAHIPGEIGQPQGGQAMLAAAEEVARAP